MKYIIAVLIILFASFADIFLYRINIIPVQPAYFLIPFFLVVCALKYSTLNLIDIFKTHTSKFFIAILVFSIVYAAFSPASTEIIKQEIVLNIIAIVFYIFAVHFFRTENKKLVFMVILGSFIVLAGSLWYDFFIGLPKYNLKLSEAVRKGGFGENPNQSASAMKFLAIGVLVFLNKLKNKRIVFILVLVISIFLTFSRSGIVSVILIIMLGTANNWSHKFDIEPPKLIKSLFKMAFLFAVLYLALILLAGIIKENFPAFTRGAAGERIDLLTGQSKKRSVVSGTSATSGRGDLLLNFLDDFMAKPLGYGTGFTTDKKYNSLNTHNHYLYIAVNFGILALILYFVYLGYGLNLSYKSNQFYYLIFVILLMAEGFVTHHIFYNRSMLISLAFFDSLIYKRLNASNTSVV